MKPIKDNPCKGCVAPKRYPGCHAQCPDYIIAKSFHEAEREEEHMKREVDEYACSKARERIDATVKQKARYKRYNKGNI